MEQVTKELVEARLIPETTRAGFPELMKALKNIQVERETIKINFENLTKAMELYSFLADKLETELAPYKEKIKAITAGYDVYMDQLLEILEAAEPQFDALNRQIKTEERARTGDMDKQIAIRKDYIEFVNRIIQLVIAATDSKELTRIQSLIGSEKSREKHYGDFFRTVESSCAELLLLVADQKVYIKDHAKLQKDYDKAVSDNDLPKASQLKEEMELQEKAVKEHANVIAESAFKQIASIDLTAEELESNAIKPRLSRWGWRVDDIELLFKKMPFCSCNK